MPGAKEDFLAGLTGLLEERGVIATGFGVVTVPLDGMPSVETFETVTLLVARLSELVKQAGMQAIAFHGAPLRITGQGGFRQLEFGGEVYPLSEQTEPNSDYWLQPVPDFKLGIPEDVQVEEVIDTDTEDD